MDKTENNANVDNGVILKDSSSTSWQFHKSLSECNEFMLKNQIGCDVTFLVKQLRNNMTIKEEPVIYQCHKYVLVSRSPVFQAMFLGELAEKGHEVTIEDVDPDAFHEMLQFIYTDKCQITGEIVMFLTYAAKKYMLPALEEKCEEYIKQNLAVDNACIILEQSLFFHNDDLTERCLDIIRFNASEAFKSVSFVEIGQETLKVILKCEDLNAEELEVFTACLNWAKHQCAISKLEENGTNLRRMLGSCLFLIRFPLITNADFSSFVSVSNVLTSEEELPLFRYICCSKKHEVPQTFNSQQRVKPEPIKIVDDTQAFSYGSSNGSQYDLNVSVSRPIKITQFHMKLQQCTRCSSGWNPNSFNVSISHRGQALQGTFIQDGNWPNVIFKMSTPLIMKAETNISIKQSKKNPHSNGYHIMTCRNVCGFVSATQVILKHKLSCIEIKSSNKSIPIYGISYIPM